MDAHPNFAYSTVAAAPSPAASGTTLTVAAGDGALFSTFPFDATVWPINTQPTVSNAEIVRITGRAGDVLTIQRAAEGTSARTIVVGDQIAVVASKKVFTDIEAAIPSIAASNTTYTSGTISVTGVGGGVTVASNTGQRIDISVAAPVAQSVQPETQTFVGAISASDALYTSGTVRMTGVGGGVTVSSNTGQRVDISVAAPVAQTVQTQNAVDVTLAGNTAGALALVSSGTMTLAGGNNVTLSQAGNAVTISAGAGGAATAISGLGNSQTTYTSGTVNLSVVAGNLTIRSTTGQAFQFSASQSVQAETQTFVGGLVGSNATYTSGTVTITGVGGGITVSSNTGQRIDLSVAAQSVQPETQTFIGGISASNTLYTSGSVRFTGSNAATVKSGTGQLVVIDVPTQTTQVETQTFVGGIANSQTTYTSGTVSLSELGAITVRSTTGNQYQLSVNAQTTQTQGILSAGVSTGGNTSGNTQVSTGSRLVFVGSNNITISQGTAAGATTLTISGPSVAGAQTGISGIANSQTTYTSGTVSLSELGAVTIRSTTGQIYQVSVNSQTNQAGTVYASSNTFGTSSGTYDARSISIAGSGAVSVAASNSGWVVSAPTQTVQTQGILSAGVSTGGNTAGNTQVSTGSRLVIVGSGNLTASQGTAAGATTITLSVGGGAETQTAISGLANSQTTYTSGTVSLSELGAITIRSTTGNQFQLSVNSQTVQTQNLVDVTLSGNTSGVQALISSGTLTLAGGNNITVSQAGNAVTISGANVGGAQTGISGIANSQTTYTSGTVSLSELGAITIRSTTGNQFQLSVNAQSVQPETQTFLAGAAASNTTYTSGTFTVTGVGGGVTVSSNTGQRIDISVAAPVAQTNQSGNVYASSNTFGTSSGTYDARSISIAGRGAVSVAASNSGWIVSAPTQTAETAISGIANSQTTYTSGTVSLSELGAVTIRSTTGNQFQISVNAQSVQPETQTFVAGIQNSQTTYTSGTVNLSVVAGNLTIRSTTGQAFQFSMSQTVQAETQTAISGLANSQTTYTSGTVSLSELGAITIRSTTGNQFQLSVNSQTNQSGNVYASSNTFGTSSGTYDARSLSIAGSGAVSVAASNSGWVISAATQTVQTQGILNVALSNIGNTQGDTGVNSGTRMVLAGGNNITLSGSSAAGASTITIIGPTPGAAQYSVGVSTGGNTSGNTGVSGTRIVFAGSNNITLSQATDATGATITISGPTAGAFSAGVSTGGNTAGDTGVTGTRMVFVGSSPISLSQATAAAGGTITINAPATSSLSGTGGIELSTNGSTISIGYGNNLADWQNMPNLQASLLTHVSGISKTPFYWNDHLDGDLTAKSLALKISMVTASQPLSVSVHLGVYTFVNSTSANRLASHSEAFVVSSASSVSLSGVRHLILTGIGTHATLSTISAGEYLLGLMFSATATNAMNFSLYGAGVGGAGGGALGGLFPGTNNMSTGTSQGIQVLQGRGSTTVNAFPSAVSAADLVNQGSGASAPLHPWIYIRS